MPPSTDRLASTVEPDAFDVRWTAMQEHVDRLRAERCWVPGIEAAGSPLERLDDRP